MKKLAMASVLLAGAAMSATIASNARPQNRAKYAYIEIAKETLRLLLIKQVQKQKILLS